MLPPSGAYTGSNGQEKPDFGGFWRQRRFSDRALANFERISPLARYPKQDSNFLSNIRNIT
jgi:hypothetical protein